MTFPAFRAIKEDPLTSHRFVAPPRPRRESTFARLDADALRKLWRLLLIVVGLVDLVQGAGYGLGPWLGTPATAPSLVLLDRVGETVGLHGLHFLPVWGWLLALGGVAILARWYALGFALGGLTTSLYAAFAVAVLLPWVQARATGWGWAWPTGLGLFHLAGLIAVGYVAGRR